MEKITNEMIKEHAELCVRISELHEYVHTNKSANDDRIEFANKSIQLTYMKKYAETLLVRLNNRGIFFENGEYFERVAAIEKVEEGNQNPDNNE